MRRQRPRGERASADAPRGFASRRAGRFRDARSLPVAAALSEFGSTRTRRLSGVAKHTILFLAANPARMTQLQLSEEARVINEELARAGRRERFDFETRWAARPLDLLRELRDLRPSIVHFSGHGADDGLWFQDDNGGERLVSAEALGATFGAAGSSVQVVLLSACYSAAHAGALLDHVPSVVGMTGAMGDRSARVFAIGFYGGLGAGESIAAAHLQGCAAISLEGLTYADQPRLAVRDGIDATSVILADDPR